MNLERTYQSVGEFVVAFQWVENKYREIGWFILDPERTDWPPMQLRTERTADLIKKVTELFLVLIEKYELPDGEERGADFRSLQFVFDQLRRFRNRLLHSTYIELKAGGEVQGLIRSNPKIGVDSETGELIWDQEPFSEDVVYGKLKESADAMFRLSQHYVQLIHWYPFDRFPKRA